MHYRLIICMYHVASVLYLHFWFVCSLPLLRLLQIAKEQLYFRKSILHQSKDSHIFDIFDLFRHNTSYSWSLVLHNLILVTIFINIKFRVPSNYSSVGSEVINKYSRDLSEAVSIYSKSPPPANWTVGDIKSLLSSHAKELLPKPYM